ncbi:MAG TPA: YHYH protein [Candidatus Saccharimonadales bacterium]|nr:YHYH protein [Candidatus Saccharimonadales bacterium]
MDESDVTPPTAAPDTPPQPAVAPQTSGPSDGYRLPPLPPSQHQPAKWLVIAGVLVLVAAAAGTAFWLLTHRQSAVPAAQSAVPTKSAAGAASQQTPVSSAQGLQLDTAKSYGNKYASGILPVGDSHYSSSGAKQGSIYACSTYVGALSSGQGGASVRGPWFTSNNTEYDLNKKTHVQGSSMWQASFSNTVSGATRTIVTNDLPTHPTGIFPITSSDPAYAYDKNPNTIKSQALSYALNAAPTYGSPQCMGGQSGVMLTGVALFNAFDAAGRDAGAWEVQDACSGHPESQGEYHYHTLSSCIKDISVHTVIGFALDGFPITGPQVSTSSILTTADLDECHGLTSQIILDGKSVTIYHYVMTQDFPYSVSCFRSTAIQPPGLQAGSQQGAQGGQQHQGPPPNQPQSP